MTTTTQLRITPEEVLAAAERTGIVLAPCECGDDTSQEGERCRGCAIVALYADASGELPGSAGFWPHAWQWAKIRYGEPYVDGFIDGFDNGKPSEERLDWSFVGYSDGAAVRAAVERANQDSLGEKQG